MIEAVGQGMTCPFGAPLDPQQEAAPTIPPLAGLTIDTSVAAPPSVSSSAMSAASETAQYITAARALFKRTERYTEASLMFFLAEKYPEIPEEHRHPLMIGAVTGAQTAAQLHVLLEGAKYRRDRGSRTTAEGARRTLSFYNLGLMSEDPDDPNPLVQVSAPEESPLVYEGPPEGRLPRERPEPEPSTSREEPRAEREHRVSEGDGNETETSTRAVELVELEIPGTQPCNRPDQREKKRSRSGTPRRSPHETASTQEPSAYPPLQDRIDQELKSPERESIRARYQGTRSRGSPELPPPPSKERKTEHPPHQQGPSIHGTTHRVPAAASSSAAAAQRHGKTTSSSVRSYVTSGRTYPGTSIGIATVRASVPGPSGESTSHPADVRGTTQPQSPPRYQASASRRPALRRQSPARGAPSRGSSTSPTGRHQTSSSRSSERRGPSKERRDYDRSRHH